MNSDNTISKFRQLLILKYIFSFILFITCLNFFLQIFVFKPFAEYLWNFNQNAIFINSSQQERAFFELKKFENRLRFDLLLTDNEDFFILPNDIFQTKIQQKAINLAINYNQDSINSIINVFVDFSSILSIFFPLTFAKKEILIVKNFINHCFYNLTDATKSFFIILLTDIFVGFHSSHGWEILVEIALKQLGLPENKDFIFLFVATFPVVLDTVFKYWIFLYLNKISPSAVATFHNMNE
jgi:hypothetical protein